MGGVRNTDPATCRRAFEQMRDDGTLSKRRLEAVEGLIGCTFPPTAGELAREMKTNRNNLATRLSEMEHLRVVHKVAERSCDVSGKECWTWWLTGRQPHGEIPRKINTNEILRSQRNRAIRKSEDLELLLNRVVNWLESDSAKGPSELKRGAVRIGQRLKKIAGEDI